MIIDKTPVKWFGPAPEKCDLCAQPVSRVFVDGATRFGLWANMCETCHHQSGTGLGLGRGQRYEFSSLHDAFVKTHG